MKQINLPKLRRPKLKNPQIRLPKLVGSRIKMPKLGGSGGRSLKSRGPQVKVPPFLENLYRDLRDRRLLLPAIGLLIAVLAVPILLKSSSPSSPAPPAPTAGGNATATEPAVLTRQLGVTNYRRRLDQLQTKNPFRQHFVVVAPSTSSGTTPTSSGATSSTGTSSVTPSSSGTTSSSGFSSSTSSSTSSGSTFSSGGSSSPSPSPSPAPTSSPSGGSASPEHHHNTKPTLFYIRRKVDVKVGPSDNFKERDGIERISFLPSASHPLVVFLGANRSATRAYFQVSVDVASASGDGHCYPSDGDCQYLVLKKGEIEHFDFAGTPYKLKLLRIRTIVSRNLGGEKPKPKSSGALAALRGLVG